MPNIGKQSLVTWVRGCFASRGEIRRDSERFGRNAQFGGNGGFVRIAAIGGSC